MHIYHLLLLLFVDNLTFLFLQTSEPLLHVACFHGHFDMANLLLQFGAAVNSLDAVNSNYVAIVAYRSECRILY